VLDDNEEIYGDEEVGDEETPHTQKFSVTIVWSPENEDRLSPSDLRVIIEDAIADLDPESTVEVSELADTL
jgi:hypothetical protein